MSSLNEIVLLNILNVDSIRIINYFPVVTERV